MILASSTAIGVALLVILCQSVVLCFIVWALIQKVYQLTLLQVIGLSVIGLWSALTIVIKFSYPYTEYRHLMLHLGMAILAVGCYGWAYRARKQRNGNQHKRRFTDRIVLP
jgi:ABC-type uncharacterized transport system permease subunit